MSIRETFQNSVLAPIAKKMRAEGFAIPSSMTMRFSLRQFESIVLKGLPEDFSLVRGCFVSEPVDSILAGFIAEKIPSGVRIHRFVFPAFVDWRDHSGNRDFHLSFSNVVPWPKDVIGGEDAQTTREVAETFLARVDPWISEMRELKDLDGFYAHLNSHEGGVTHNFKQAMAFTQILLGDPCLAEEYLNSATRIVESFEGELRRIEQQFVDENKRFLALLRTRRLSEAQNILEARVSELKTNFGIA